MHIVIHIHDILTLQKLVVVHTYSCRCALTVIAYNKILNNIIYPNHADVTSLQESKLPFMFSL